MTGTHRLITPCLRIVHLAAGPLKSLPALLTTLGLFLLTFAAATPVAASASTPTTPAAIEGAYFRNVATQRCIDDSFEFGLRSFPCNRHAPYQRWMRVGNDGAWRNLATGRCMDDSVAFGLRAIACNGLAYQGWFHYAGSGRYWQNEATGRCLDDSQLGLRSFPCNQLTYQAWEVLTHQ